MEMPQVSGCQVTDCAYNLDRKCHALAITIGDGIHPHCDTFCRSSSKGGDLSVVARVGACKVTECRFNKSLECGAPSILVGYHEHEVECLTYKHI